MTPNSAETTYWIKHRDDAEEIHEKIVRAEDAPAPLRLDLLLQMRVERHDKKRPGHAHGEKRERENSPSSGRPRPASNALQIRPHEPIGISPISTWCVVMRVTRKLPQMMPTPSVAA